MKNGECVWCEGAPFTYKQGFKTMDGRTEPGWHILDGIGVTGGDPSPIAFGIGSLLETSDGTVISVKSPCYAHDRKGSIKVDFFIKQGGSKIPDSDRGLAVYYDKNLKHRTGNHRQADHDLDIVKIFTGELYKRCPHCSEILD